MPSELLFLIVRHVEVSTVNLTFRKDGTVYEIRAPVRESGPDRVRSGNVLVLRKWSRLIATRWADMEIEDETENVLVPPTRQPSS